MKKVFMSLICLFLMITASLSAKAQEITITLLPGCTWISYTNAEAMSITAALGDFVPMEGDVIKSQYASTTYSHGRWMGRLQQFTPGLGYMYISMRGEPVSFVFANSTPQSQVTVTTSEPMLVTAISAMCGGEVTTNDGTYIITKGLCWATHENPTTNDDFYQEAESGVGSFSLTMTGLNISTTYYVRAYAVTPNGTVYGNEKVFTTRDGIPTVTTTEVTNIQAETATCGGNVTDNCGLTVTARGICWSTSPNPTLGDSHTTNGNGMGSFSSSITGLSLSTTYYVRAYATTAAGTAYGEQVSFTTRNGIPTVTTADITNILDDGATGGGNVTDNGGLDVVSRGVCWSTSSNPTLDDSHTTNGNGMGSFTSSITGLSISTTYYVRAYANTSAGTGYGEEVSFTTQSSSVGLYVDLGLPSGTLWATCNVGADIPEDEGDYFAWGETQPQSDNAWEDYWGTYLYYESGELTKYTGNDGLTILQPSDDAATANWGEGWRMPTREEWNELIANTTSIWTTWHGIKGCLFTASNGNCLFLPQTIRYEYEGYYYGFYWSSSLFIDAPFNAWYCGICSDMSIGVWELERAGGMAVRPVRCKNSSINVTTNLSEGGVVSGGGTYLDHTSCTISAMANEDYIFMYWTENGEVVSAEATYTFVVNGNRNLVANFAYSYSVGGHGYVDLGLPSGTLWATCNVGADTPFDDGDHFAWGETQPKDYYSDWSNYQHCMGSSHTLTKYCNNAEYGYNGFTDNLTTLLPEDDAATANWGADWRMPTKQEWQELYQNTIHTWITQNNVFGLLLTASNGNILFLPTVLCYVAGEEEEAEYLNWYWSSSLDPSECVSAYEFEIYENFCDIYSEGRDYNLSVRPVRAISQSIVPMGAVDGLFSVSANQQVYFSQGNMQYQPSTNTWRFADNQYDHIGSANSNISSTYSGWIDLFGWGTSGYNHGANCYQPWSTSQTNSNYYAYGSYNYNLYDQTGKADWGYNPIANGGNTVNRWRTLTQPEWNYVFNTRITTSGIRYAKAKVNNVNGVILLPDNWSSSTYSLSSINTYNASFGSNTITASQWTILENAGAVFLPVAGRRYGTTIDWVSSYGGYWSAGCAGESDAGSFYFNDSNLNTSNNYPRCYGRSVRLVCPAE